MRRARKTRSGGVTAAAWVALIGVAVASASDPAPANPASGLHDSDLIELRGGGIVRGRIISVDAGGVSLARAADRARERAGPQSGEAIDRFGWDRIVRFEPRGGAGAWPGSDHWLEEGAQLWRARIRLERGDAALAAESLGGSLPRLEGDGPTSVVRALVALQLAVATGRQEAALEAALEAMRLRRRGFDEPGLSEWLEPTSEGSFLRRPLLDPTTGLPPLVPPFAGSEMQRRQMLAALERFDPRGDAVLEELRALYASVLDPTQPLPERIPPRAPERPGERGGGRGGDRGEEDAARTSSFLRALRDAQSPDGAERRRGRETLASLRRRLPEWTEAWARMAAGRGLLMESEPGLRRAGQIELLHLPARFADMQPWLAAQATLLAAQASRADGRDDEARRLEAMAPHGLAAPESTPHPSPDPPLEPESR